MNIPGTPSSRAPIPSRPAPVRPGEEIAGKYRVGRVLGAGAMGVVVRAWHIELEQEVALKFLHPELAIKADGAERFRREARAAVRIRSDHVARVLDVGTLEGSHIPFIVMEYLQGRDLARELAARGSLPVDEAARHVIEACDAIGEAHTRGIVHRDLKPANLFLAERSGGVQMIKVLDFGISKTLGNGPKGLSITEPATLMGSPGYMSPEQLESSRNVDARTDIWSLGVILQEMVTGCLPFDGDSVPQLIRAVITGNRPLLTEYGPALAMLEPVVARCLQQDRAQRFQTIAELKQALLPLASPTVMPPAAPAPSPSLAPSPQRTREPISAPGSIDRGAPSLASQSPSAPPGDPATSGQPAPLGGGVVGSGPANADARVGGDTTGAHGPGATPDSAWGRTHGIGRAPLWRTLALAAALGATAAFAFWRGRTALQSFGTQPESGQTAGLGGQPVPSALEPPAPAPSPPSTAASDAPGPTAPSASPSAALPAETPVVLPPSPRVAPIGPNATGGTAPMGAQPPGATVQPALEPSASSPASSASAPAPAPVAPGTPRPAQPTPAARAPAKRVGDAASLDIGAALGGVAIEAPPATAPASDAPATPPADAPAPRREPPAEVAESPQNPPPPAAPAPNPYEIPEFGGRK